MHHLLPLHGVAHIGYLVLEAEHLCMSLRGVQTLGAKTTTSALRGLIRRPRPYPPGVPGPDHEDFHAQMTRPT